MDLLAIGTLAAAGSFLTGLSLGRQVALRAQQQQRAHAGTIPMLAGRRAKRQSAAQRRRQKQASAAPPPARRHPSPWRRGLIAAALLALVAIGGGAVFLAGRGSLVAAQAAEVIEIAAQLPMTGDGAQSGHPLYEGMQLAIEEANAGAAGPPFKLTLYDDQSSDELAREMADQIVASQAMVALGPAFSTTAIATGPIYAAAGMAVLPPSATSDLITQSPSTFRVVFKNSDQGELLANYLVRVLGQKRAAVFVVDTAYGQTLREGFERTATKLGLAADYYVFTDEIEANQMARQVAQQPEPPPVVLFSLKPEGARLLATLRRLGVPGPFLGGDALSGDSFKALLANQPEEQARPGFFTDGLYSLTPVILDSASADILAFAGRYQARFGYDPSWLAVAGYDAANLAIAATRAATAGPAANRDLLTQRVAVLNYILGINSAEKALPGLLGPFWFDENRARPQAIRVGRFSGGRFESAPLQIVAVATPDPAEITSGAVFELSPGRYGRLQRVVYTGVFLNEIPRIDLPGSSFNADFYLWLRFAREAGPGSADPTSLLFPNLASGSFNRDEPTIQRTMEDGTEYWLWHVQGEFHNDFDLRRFPFDHQDLAFAFFNSRAAVDQVVYVVDERGSPEEIDNLAAAAGAPAIVSPAAFRKLSQWEPRGAVARRESLAVNSALGDQARVGQGTRLELAGFLVTVNLARRALATLPKTVLPLLLITLFMFAALYFPAAMVKEKVTVVITGALAGAVLLTAIDAQLGAVSYPLMLEYVFYVFFALALLCIIAVLSVGRLRAAGNTAKATIIEAGTRVIFIITVIATVAMTTMFLWHY